MDWEQGGVVGICVCERVCGTVRNAPTTHPQPSTSWSSPNLEFKVPVDLFPCLLNRFTNLVDAAEGIRTLLVDRPPDEPAVSSYSILLARL